MFYNNRQVCNLNELNNVLQHLTPSISGVSSDMFHKYSDIADFLNAAIMESHYVVIDGIKRTDLFKEIDPILMRYAENNNFRKIEYDTHGDKHFVGGPNTGTKFKGAKESVNKILTDVIDKNKEKIRSIPERSEQSVELYVQLIDSFQVCPDGYDMITIQVSYDKANDSIVFHGYPDNIGKTGVCRHKIV